MNEKRQRQQQQIAQQQAILDRRAKILEEDPELGKFVNAKTKWIRILLLAGFVLQIAYSFTMGWVSGDASVGMFFLRLLGYWKYLMVLILCGSSMKNIKMAGGIYFCVIVLSVMKIVQQRAASGTDFSILMLCREMLKTAPGVVVIDILSRIYDLTIIVTFVCLLAVPKNRNRIEKFDFLMSGASSMSEIAKRKVD